MKTTEVKEILEKIKDVKIAVYGDFCLDAYWILDPKGGEVSVETGIKTQAVSRQYYTLGGAANVVANVAALRPASIMAIGVIGDNIFANEMRRQLQGLGIDTESLVTQRKNFDTITFAKRYIEDEEQQRIDFGFHNKRSQETDEAILKAIEKSLQECDVLIFNQQVPGSINNEEFIGKANNLFDKYDDKIVVFDSRHYGNKFHNVYRKTNEVEAARLNGVEADSGDIITAEKIKEYALKLYNKSSKPVFVTRGERGSFVVDSSGITEIPGIQIMKKVDTVGAGDTTTSAVGLCLAAGYSAVSAGKFANYCAAVTVQKLFQTGVASPDEVVHMSENANYIYLPELADDTRRAKYVDETEIEICYSLDQTPTGSIKHAIFDHDGTISTLRQGWETVMEPVMVKAILGDKYETADETLYHKVVTRAKDYIDKSTGIQTILQMEALIEIIKEFGLVEKDKILDKFGYKEIYNDALMEMVNKRMGKLKEGELSLEDYTVKGSVDFLKQLKAKGVKLYLASGTDRDDVINEAKVLGYADMFDGGIYGSVGDVSKYSKKMVIDKIISDNKLSGAQLGVFGDGPVEIQETRKKGGLTVGIASDEVQRFGLNAEKRARLIKAGAHIVVPDFSQREKLLEFVFNLG
jgi:rfaE bifunctional protein kinase chain/domain